MTGALVGAERRQRKVKQFKEKERREQRKAGKKEGWFGKELGAEWLGRLHCAVLEGIQEEHIGKKKKEVLRKDEGMNLEADGV